MELENKTRYNNVRQSLFEAPPHQIVSQSPQGWKFIGEYAFHEVLAYKLETYTNTVAVFKFPATMIFRQHK